MIRYRTRDITRLNNEPCICGRTHVRIMRVTGRDDDMLIVRGVNVFPLQVGAVLVGFPGLAPHYQIVLTWEGTRCNGRDRDRTRCEHDRRRPRWHAKKVSGHIKSLIGVTCNVVIKLPGEVPRSQGKAERVKDERKR